MALFWQVVSWLIHRQILTLRIQKGSYEQFRDLGGNDLPEGHNLLEPYFDVADFISKIRRCIGHDTLHTCMNDLTVTQSTWGILSLLRPYLITIVDCMPLDYANFKPLMSWLEQLCSTLVVRIRSYHAVHVSAFWIELGSNTHKLHCRLNAMPHRQLNLGGSLRRQIT